MVLKINGIDFSSYVEKNSYLVSYETREGNNGGMMLDGSWTNDIIAFKATVTFTIVGMTAARLAEITSACLDQYVNLTYLDTRTNSQRTAQFMPSVGTATYAFARHGLDYFRNGMTLTFRER